jgi:hypothetical protein
MQSYEWHGGGSIHTPDGVRGPEDRSPFVASLDWIAQHRQWVQSGLITPVKTEKRRSKK